MMHEPDPVILTKLKLPVFSKLFLIYLRDGYFLKATFSRSLLNSLIKFRFKFLEFIDFSFIAEKDFTPL